MSVYMFQMSSSFCVFRQTGNGIISMHWCSKLLPVILVSPWVTFKVVTPQHFFILFNNLIIQPRWPGSWEKVWGFFHPWGSTNQLSERSIRHSGRKKCSHHNNPCKNQKISEAFSSALGSPISNWTTDVGPPVHEVNTLFSKPPCETSVRATNARKPDVNIANWAEDKQKTMPKRKSKGYHLAYLNLWWNRMVREARKDELEMKKEKEKSKMKEYLLI